jgi:hypothetical protein
LAATPQQIYKDYADNGRLDGHYSKSDLNRALKSAVLQGYGSPNVNTGLAPSAQQQVAAVSSAQTGGSGGGLPFTGVDLAFMVAGGGMLVLLGLGLRRAARSNS